MRGTMIPFGLRYTADSKPGTALVPMRLHAVGKLTGQFVCLFVVLAVMASAGWAAESLEAVVNPPAISIGAFYDGANVEVNGSVPADCEAIIRITGKRSDLHLRKKGKALGLLWMNLGTLTIENVPNAYLLFIPDDFDETVSAPTDSTSAHQLTLASLEQQIEIVPQPPDKNRIFNEFLKLKASEGLYAEKKGNIHYGETEQSVKPFQADLKIPSRLAPGEYKVDLYAVKKGQIVAHTAQTLPVKLAGFPAMLFTLAFQHGALYGVLATLVALFAGLLMGFFFGGGKGAH